MATAKDTDQDEVSRITTDDVIVSSGSEHDVISHAPNIGYTVPAYQGICNVTVNNKEYSQTPALDEAYDILQRTGWVILCGPPGSGKTKLAYALSRLSRDQDPRHFAPYVLEHLEQLKPEVGKSEYSVVILDGILGKVRIKNQQYDCWELVLDTILKLREEGTCRFVITVYPHVLRELQQLETDRDSPLLDNSAVIWLTDALPEDVKVQLLDFHLDKLSLETARRRQVVEDILKKDISGPVFPPCCDDMVKHWDVSRDPTAIFEAPAEVHTGLFKRMVLHHTHGDVFAALFSLTMKGMSQFLHDPFKTETHLKELGLYPYSPDKLAAYADVLLGSILSKGTFSSRVLYEAAGLALGRYFRLPVLVAVCDTPFLVQYVDITINHGIPEEQRANMCVAVGSVPCCSNDPKQCAEDFQALVKRTYTEIVQGNLQLICQHPCLQHPQFLQELVNHCAGNGKMIKQLLNAEDPEYRMPLVYWSAFLPSHHLTHWCLLKMQADRKLSTRVWMAWSLVDNITQSSKQSLQSILHETVTARHFEYSEYTMEFPLLGKDQCLTKEMQKQIEILKEAGSTQGRLLYLLDPSLPIPPEIVTLQMTRGKLKLRVQDRRHWYLVFRLLTDREVNETDSDFNSLLHVAVTFGQFTAVRLCLKAGAVISQQNRHGVHHIR